MCAAVYNAKDAAALMWESYLKYHDRPQLFVWDNASTDGVSDYFAPIADYYYRSPENIQHGMALDNLCKMVTTKYTVIADTDIEFHQAVVPYMLEQEAAMVGQYHKEGGPWEHNGKVYRKQPRIDTFFALFETEVLQEVLRHITFSPYFTSSLGTAYDAAGMVAVAFYLLKAKVSFVSLDGYVTHYGSIASAVFETTVNQGQKEAKQAVYEHIGERLAALRGETKEVKLL